MRECVKERRTKSIRTFRKEYRSTERDDDKGAQDFFEEIKTSSPRELPYCDNLSKHMN